MSKIFFTADTHFGHAKIIEYSNRPFKTVEEMDNTLINNWNLCVGKDDLVYHLGDFAFANPKQLRQYRKRLNGRIILIEGNHDKPRRWNRETRAMFERISKIDSYVYNGMNIVLCHYAMRIWNRSHFDTWHLFGHTHGMLPPFGKSWDVGVDNHNDFSPMSLTEIEVILEARPHNENYIAEST